MSFFLSLKFSSIIGNHQMMKSVRQLQQLFLVAVCVFTIKTSRQDNSVSDLTTMGWEFVSYDTSYPSLFTFTTTKKLYCSLECNKRIDCRTFDFDANSRQCRLWDVDQTKGSIVVSSTKPRSSVGTIRLSASIYANSHNQSCDKCVQSRYEICNTSSNTCQCPSKTYWNGSMCLVQLLSNQIYSQVNICRSDLYLTCQPSCDLIYRCSVCKFPGFFILLIVKRTNVEFKSVSLNHSISCIDRHIFYVSSLF
jgi:hypothetical protein